MPKQTGSFNFAQGLDTKTDPFQIDAGKFLALKNVVFTTGKRLTKRNGFGALASLPYASKFVTTFNDNLTALGSKIQAYSSESESWTSISNFYPCNLSTQPIVRTTTNQSQVDSAVASNGLLCVAWTDQTPTALSTKRSMYAVYDSSTGQQLLAPTALTGADVTYGAPRVFVLGNFFIVAYTALVTATYNIKYVAISTASLSVSTATAVTTSVTPGAGVAWDGVVMNGYLYFAWNGATTSGLKMATLSATLSLSSNVIIDASHVSTQVSVCADTSAAVIYVTYYDSVATDAYTVAVSPLLVKLTSFPVKSISSTAVANLATCVAVMGTLTIFFEVTNAYSYDGAVASNFIKTVTVTSAAVVGTVSTVVRSVGLASKAFVISSIPYFFASYSSPYQPTYFLINGSNGNQIAQLAYENGGGYLTNGLPSVYVSGSTIGVAYLVKDFIQALSNANAAGTSVVGGIYSQTGINQATLVLGTSATITTAEIGLNLNASAGFLWGYDGTQATEQGFFLYPDSVEATSTATTGGHLAAQIYYYAVIYSWTDNRGNIFRSAESIPVIKDISGAGTATSTITIQGPNLRLTYKSNVKIEIYRWSTAQQNFYQVTSIASPLINSTSADSWTFTDTLADASIVGNALLYTTGGVVEDSGGPSFSSVFTFDDRLFGIYSEDRNKLGYSKQIIEGTPVELSTSLTLFVAPSIGAQGPTGDLTCGAQMDDKAILFKPTGLYYINGSGPDNTGSNSGYSQPIFITSMAGCSNQASIVFQPQGLMFEFASEAGNQIWMLRRDLQTEYIGAPVEGFLKEASVTSAVAIPGSTRVKFTLSSGITLVYDYYYGQWNEDTTNALSSTIYQGLHTYINSYGATLQETPGLYLDGTHPVLISFTTGWLGFAGIRGYERIHEFSFLGTYYSPHKLFIQVAFDYGGPIQNITYSPDNFSPAYGDAPVYGDGVYGGPSNIEQFRVFTKKQKCKAFQISIQEIYDPSFEVAAGAGLSLSGINFVMTLKKGYAPVIGKNSIG